MLILFILLCFFVGFVCASSLVEILMDVVRGFLNSLEGGF